MPVSFDAHPRTYRHWRLRIEDDLAWLVLDVDEHAGLSPGYELKLNSYDLGVDIELHDAVQRLRFEHPQVRTVILTSGKPKVFCAGANIRMLAAAEHHWKVNFCKFTNETRNAMEDATAHSGQTYLAAVNGPCAGGGYELALACAHILLVDDNSATVSLPEVALLGVLPGTGGLTRLVDKRGVRRDLADVFATRPDGVKGATALAWRLVDELAPPRRFDDAVRHRARALAGPPRPGARGVELTPLRRTETPDGLRYDHVTADYDRAAGTVAVTVHAPGPDDEDWPLAMTRQLDDLILRLRVNEPELGTWLLRTAGDPAAVLAHDRRLRTRDDWLTSEIVHHFKRTLKRLDVTSRSLVALIEPGSCFAGPLAELALAADRQYVLDTDGDTDGDTGGVTLTLTEANLGLFPMGNGLSRLASRFWGDPGHLDLLALHLDTPLAPARALELGLVTDALDDLDWDEEIRLVVEGRAALSPDACTGMEANHRFAGPETVETKIFGRLSAWQNWIFNRPNASGEAGALARYGTGRRAVLDRKRV
ncbi:benzoyl-CoA-dihydrodiol lyase [Actinophytocola xinjiangensis]|uniref:Benzoyl-CoA-dihydrodiol lyase n=1 Tax=Actinophytocola xinjiangensis TaxID=485602 RepID=A0A7Z1B021_9PSEU|nr:2,3-epoxybenzoyl-CoA dihydrolase [Actinophytocola xinjiangensis]OLF11429.1 benzoyl-CoA-dihydrodiol lyase [Actinophytocola xinjiangensis]